MSTDHLIFLSVAGLRPCDIDAERTPTLAGWVHEGVLCPMTPTFPCVTSPVQASMWTGTGPDRHGVIANGFYFRDRREVEFWVGRNGVIDGVQLWSALRAARPQATSAIWHGQNVKDAAADYIVTPAPIHEPDGTTRLWCYSKPEGLYQELVDALGHFPLQHYWGPLANIESTRWILDAAAWLIDRAAPHLHWIYLPHLDYAAQRFGPDSPQATTAVAELDERLGAFAARVRASRIGEDAVFLVVGEYAMTEATGVVYPNRILRDAGLLSVREENGVEHIDLHRSAVFAMVDHQFAHVYVNAENAEEHRRIRARVVELFQRTPGVEHAAAGADRNRLGIEHPRSGDIVLVCDPAHWLAYYWWFDDKAAPPFARTVDIHRKPGYDPVELFVDPETKSIPLDASLVRGTHGAPAVDSRQRTALICSRPCSELDPSRVYRDVDIKRIALSLLGAD